MFLWSLQNWRIFSIDDVQFLSNRSQNAGHRYLGSQGDRSAYYPIWGSQVADSMAPMTPLDQCLGLHSRICAGRRVFGGDLPLLLGKAMYPLVI